MKQPQLNFTEPVLCTSNAKDWFIYFEYYHNGQWIDRKRREGLNRIKNIKERKIHGEQLRLARFEWLKTGWNPITDPEFKLRNIVNEQGDLPSMTFAKAMDFALENKKIATKSRLGYKSQLEYIKKAVKNLGFDTLPISQFKRLHVMHVMKRLQKDRKLSNHGYNKHIDTIRSMFSMLLTWQAIEFNPASKIEHLKTPESNKFQSYDDDEKNKITEHLFSNHYRFYVYLQVLYHTGIRPKELLALKISDVDLKKQTITIVPDLEEENSKTLNVRHVTINNQLLPFLRELQLQEYPAHFYLFGSPIKSKSGKGGGGGSQKTASGQKYGTNREDYFKPSGNRIKRDNVTKLWKRVVIDELGINKYLYAAKHTGADDKILAGIDLDALRELYGHTSKLMTETYAKKVKEVYKRQIIDKSPGFNAPAISN